MRIGILSDTHDQLARTGRAVASLAAAGAEALVHCGDLTGPAIVHACARLPSYYVFGNNDFDEIGLRAAMAATGGTCLGRGDVIRLGGKRIAVAHGDRARDLARLAATGPDYLLSGHSHRAGDRTRGAARWINPGALHRARTRTVALLDLERDDLRFLAID